MKSMEEKNINIKRLGAVRKMEDSSKLVQEVVLCEELMDLLVVLDGVGGLGAGELVDGFGDFGFGDFGVDGFEGGLEAWF